MHANYSFITIYLLKITLVVLGLLNSINGRRFSRLRLKSSETLPKRVEFALKLLKPARVKPRLDYPDVFGREYGPQEQENKVKTALAKLEHEPQWDPSWPDPLVKLGQVSGVAMTSSGLVLVFHRGPNVWEGTTFNIRNVYQSIGEPAIAEPTVLVFHSNGTLLDQWGENLFYMPHGITTDAEDNVWLTDVALHQVFKFSARDRTRPQILLGEKFVPGDDDSHFCKPSAVAVMSTGDFFVADGYCNTRIIKYTSDGTKILQWGRGSGDSPFVFSIPHALTLAEEHDQVCVADRERGRVGCFRASNGTYVNSYSSWLIGGRLFSVAYTPVDGGRLYVVNGPPFAGSVPVRGYVIGFQSGRLIQTFAPGDQFSNPHDVVTSPDGSEVYVAELRPFKVYKFVEERLKISNVSSALVSKTPAKPTATVELSPSPHSGWSWALGAAAAGGGLLLAGGGVLLSARARGRSGAPRRRWEYGSGPFKLRRLLARPRRRQQFTRVRSDDSDDEPDPMLPPPTA